MLKVVHLRWFGFRWHSWWNVLPKEPTGIGASDWLEFASLGKEEKKDYIIATGAASLVWLANLASLELHQLHSRNQILIALITWFWFGSARRLHVWKDCSDRLRFKTVHWIVPGYHPFVKTTGGKGIHICCPLEPKHDFHTVFEAAQSIAQPLLMHIKKNNASHQEKRERVGVDWYL